MRWLGATLAIGGLVLTGCTGGDKEKDNGPTAEEAGGKVIGSFVSAWRDDSPADFNGVVDEPQVARRDIAAHVDELAITHTKIELNDDLNCSSSSCSQHATVTQTLAGAGDWTYETLVKTRMSQGQWLVQWSPGTFHPDLTEVTTLVRVRTLPPRAPIVDRHGTPLTPLLEIAKIGVVPKDVKPRTYVQLKRLLDVDVADLRSRVAAAQPDWFVPVIDLRQEAYEPLHARLLEVPGISIDTAKRSLAPTSSWGRAILGTVAPATEATLENAGPLALPTDEVGESGLQEAFQAQLAGTPGIRIQLVENATGDVLNTVHGTRPSSGHPLETSLDFDIQDVAEDVLANAKRPTYLVVVKASTGEVLAGVNAPGPTSYNATFVGKYAPGSTFKVISAATLLSQGVKPNQRISCPDTRTVGGKSFKNYDRGLLPNGGSFAQAFAESCNTTFVGFADTLAAQDLTEMATRFGVGAEWDMGLPGFSGSVPPASDLVTRAADMIGQGKVEMSALGMALVAATVDSGVARAPTLVPETNPGIRIGEVAPSVVAKLRSMMRLVVTGGTAQALAMPGAPVFAKTGTAEVERDGNVGTNAWLIGYRGDLAFAIMVEGGESGAHDAAPLVRELLSSLPDSADQ